MRHSHTIVNVGTMPSGTNSDVLGELFMMREVRAELPRFAPMYAWANRILRVDLTQMKIWAQETAPYVPDYLGARGIAARIAWEEYPEPMDPFDPASPLMVFAGALTGARSPYSGRANVCGFSPQGYPYPWFTRSNIGGHFGGELKRAGYDGIIITGAAERPVRLLIRDDSVSVLPAEELWGLGTLETLSALESAERGDMRSLVIGPAGERLSRIATIHTATSSACGHGGFGAVMGSKKLKAISVIGSGQLRLADPDRIADITRALTHEVRPFGGRRSGVKKLNQELMAKGEGRARPYACTEYCLSPCGVYYEDVPGCTQERRWEGHWFCVGGIFRGMSDDGPISRKGVFDWRLGHRGGFEVNMLSNDYGLNQWDLVIGLVPWLEACQHAGLVSDVNGHEMDWRSCEFWAEFLHAIAYREGMGEALAEGGWAAARLLHLGEDLVRRYYTGWGHAGHWDGHGDWANYIVFPFWLVPALQWLTDTRDPIPSGHGYGARAMSAGPFSLRADAPPLSWDQMRAIGERIYGSSAALDPFAGYEGKAFPGVYHKGRSVIKDCVPVDDFVFPLIYSAHSKDGFCRVGDIDGPAVEYHLFKTGTGLDWSEETFELAVQRVYTLERALVVRHWGRDRHMDEMVLPSFEYLENWPSPALGERQALDRERFRPVMDEYYRLLGWDPETGWPTRERLELLGLANVYEEMIAGARQAKALLPEPPRAEPVPLVHG